MSVSISRIRGCVLGAAAGDALGAPFEFLAAGEAVWQLGGGRISDLRSSGAKSGPHGVWSDPSPAGTGTDDTRYNWLFLELAAELRRMPTADELAERFLRVYEEPGSFFPTNPDLARSQLEIWEGVCRGRLGEASELHPGVPPEVLRERSVGLNMPSLAGLITLTSAGLLFPGEPEEAYRAAWLADFYDVGYAREATAIFAAAISLAVAGEGRARRVLFAVDDLDPYHLGGPFGEPYIKDRLLGLCNRVDTKGPESVIAKELSVALRNLHPFDPLKALVIAFVSCLAGDGDPARAVRIAANHRGVEGRDRLTEFQDVDSYGCVTGALAGALFGGEALPEDWVTQVVESDREQYGFDLEETITRFAAVVGGD